MEIFRQVKKGNEGYIVRQHHALKMYNSCIIRCFSSGRDADISVIGFKLCAISQVSVTYFCSRFYSSQISVFNEKKTCHCSADNMKLILPMRRPFLISLFQMVIMGCSGASMIAIWNNGIQNGHRIGMKRSIEGNSVFFPSHQFAKPHIRTSTIYLVQSWWISVLAWRDISLRVQ